MPPRIARLWEGSTRAADGDVYLQYLKATGLGDYLATPGNCGVLTLRRQTEERTDFLLISLWESDAAIRAFTGGALLGARYYPEDERYLIAQQDEVRHFDLVDHTGVTVR